jgi:hypothetical protein
MLPKVEQNLEYQNSREYNQSAKRKTRYLSTEKPHFSINLVRQNLINQYKHIKINRPHHRTVSTSYVIDRNQKGR